MKAVRTVLSYVLFAVGLGFFASTVVATEFAHKSGEAVTPVGFWWPVAAGVACLQGSIRLSVAPRLRGIREWLGEAGRNAAALLLMAGSFAFFSLTSDEKQSFGGRVLSAAVMPAAGCGCFVGWFWLSIRTRRDAHAKPAKGVADGSQDQREAELGAAPDRGGR